MANSDADKPSILTNEHRILHPISLISDEPVLEQDELGLGKNVWSQIVAGVATGTEGLFTIGLCA